MIERRITSVVRVRSRISGPPVLSRSEGTTKSIEGYGAVFWKSGDPGAQYDLYGDASVLERIAPTAFDRAIRENADVRSLFNHDANCILGRTAAGTLRIRADSVGLRFEIPRVPETRWGNDVWQSIRRGDVSGASFMFEILSSTWSRDGDTRIRTLTDLVLFEVGPVCFPAYESTTAETSRAALHLDKHGRAIEPKNIDSRVQLDLLRRNDQMAFMARNNRRLGIR